MICDTPFRVAPRRPECICANRLLVTKDSARLPEQDCQIGILCSRQREFILWILVSREQRLAVTCTGRDRLWPPKGLTKPSAPLGLGNMHGRQLSSVALQPPLQLAGTAQRRVAADGKTIAAALIKESKQRAALVAPQPLDAALLSRLRADSCSLSQLDPLSSLVQCPTLRQPSLLEQPGSQSAEFLTLLQDPSIPPHRLEATLYEPRPKSQKPDRDPKGEDFYANVGYAIRTLREELPTLFQEDLTCEPLIHLSALSSMRKPCFMEKSSSEPVPNALANIMLIHKLAQLCSCKANCSSQLKL